MWLGNLLGNKPLHLGSWIREVVCAWMVTDIWILRVNCCIGMRWVVGIGECLEIICGVLLRKLR